jgi:hypothetical protein
MVPHGVGLRPGLGGPILILNGEEDILIPAGTFGNDDIDLGGGEKAIIQSRGNVWVAHCWIRLSLRLDKENKLAFIFVIHNMRLRLQECSIEKIKFYFDPTVILFVTNLKHKQATGRYNAGPTIACFLLHISWSRNIVPCIILLYEH